MYAGKRETNVAPKGAAKVTQETARSWRYGRPRGPDGVTMLLLSFLGFFKACDDRSTEPKASALWVWGFRSLIVGQGTGPGARRGRVAGHPGKD